MNLEEAQWELEAICDFDTLFVMYEDVTDSSQLIRYIIRQCRKQELLELISARN